MKFITKILLFLIVILSVSIFAQRRKGKEAMKRQGILQMKSGKYGEAIDLFNKYIAAYPREPEGYNLRALSYEKRQIYKYAVLDLRRAITLTPKNGEYKKNLNRVISVWYPILRKKIEGHKREIAIDKYSAFDYLEIGKSYRWLEEWNNAELWYDKYLALDDDASPDEIIRYSIILTKTRHIKKGEIVLKKWVDRYPEDWRLWSRYGYFTLWLGHRDNAANAFSKALEFKPFFKEAQDGLDIATNKGYIIKDDDGDRERRRIKKYAGYPIDLAFKKLRKNPADSDTRFKLVGLLIDVNRIEEAKEQLNILKKKHEDSEKYKELDARLSPLLEAKYSSLLEENLAKLKENPDNREITKSVANYYTNLERYDEANEIMDEYLSMHPDDNEMKEYYADILAHTGDFVGGAEVLSQLINSGYTSDKIVEKAANYYGNDFDFDNSIRIINEHIDGKPLSQTKDLKFQLAKYYAWNYQWDDARDQVDELLEVYPDNNKYKLFQSQLIVWTVDDTEFDSAEASFNDILAEEPDNLEGMLGLATIHSWKREYPEAKALIDRAYSKYPDNPEIASVESFYNAQFALEDDRLKMEKRSEIGELVNEEDYDGALELFDEYFEMDDNPSKQVMKEYAQVNIAAENFDTAIDIYNDMLEEEYDDEIALERANAYLWSGDSLNALNKFIELSEKDPENFDAKMGLADSYYINQEYGEAEDIYDELLEETEDSVQAELLKQKKDMLPMYGMAAGLNSAFQYILPTNLSIVPTARFYDDNQELTYLQYGLRAEVGILRYFTIGATWMRTHLFSSNPNYIANSQVLTEFSGQAYFHPFKHFSIGGSLGRLNIEGEDYKRIGTIEARWFSDNLLLRAGYRDTDARLALFSPNLLYKRLDTYVYHFSGNYKLKDKYKFLLFYQYFIISDGNIGNDFRFRLGKAFRPNLFVGYEYLFTDYGFSADTKDKMGRFIHKYVYYSPQEFSTHSIWVDYEYSKIENLELVFGGKIGYAPTVDFIVGDIYVDAGYQVLDNLSLNGRATYGISYRNYSSYQFISIFLSAYWSIW